MKRILWILFLISLLDLCPCFGQMAPSMVTSTARPRPNREIEIRATYKMEPGPIRSFVGDPFSLKRIFQKNQALADGTAIERQSPVVLHYQDSQGRVRTEYPFRMPPRFQTRFQLPPQVDIIDPVAGYHYVLDTVHRIAHRGVIEVIQEKGLPPVRNARQMPFRSAAGGGNSSMPQRSIEFLGTKEVDGILLEGRRISTTFPSGSPLGNNQPVTIRSEEWSLPGSSMPPFRQIQNPISGNETAASFDIVRMEPDPKLFLAPADYRVVEEDGPFAVTYILSLDSKQLR